MTWNNTGVYWGKIAGRPGGSAMRRGFVKFVLDDFSVLGRRYIAGTVYWGGKDKALWWSG